MKLIHFLGFSALTFVSVVTGFPAYRSLAGLSIEERDLIIPKLQVRQADPPPEPLNDTSANDKDHPWKPLQPDDLRGPCPGLNILAPHGVRRSNPYFHFCLTPYLCGGFRAMVLLLLPKSSTQPNKVPCNGIQCYELLTLYLLGFNMGNDLAVFVTYAAMLVDGNMITNLFSIGDKSLKTGPDTP